MGSTPECCYCLKMELFEKKFEFKVNNKVWQLPNVDVFYSTEEEKYEPLQVIKRILNYVKNKLNDYRIEGRKNCCIKKSKNNKLILVWNEHTRKRNPAQQIVFHLKNEIKAEFVTQAFAKVFECISAFEMISKDLGDNFYSAHLCECPGAFINSINHYLKLHHPQTKFHYIATTLNPYFEGNKLGNMILDDRFILHTLEHWFFGETYNGDILEVTNIKSLLAHCKSLEINLVTCDGSIDCLDEPENQELHVSKLHTAELVTALALLANNGSLLLKIFTFFELTTISMLYVLNCCFTNVHLFKPASSKEGNSEVYVIAIGYKKEIFTDAHVERILENLHSTSKTMLPLKVLPQDFLMQVTNAARFFMNQQVMVIENNIKSFIRYDKSEYQRIKTLKLETVRNYVQLYNMRPIAENQKLLQGIRYNTDLNLNVRVHSGSHADRINFHNLSRRDQLQIMYDRLKYFYDYASCHMLTKEGNILELSNDRLPQEFVKFIHGRAIVQVMSSKFILVTIMKYFMDLRSFMEEQDSEDDNLPNYSIDKNTLDINVHYWRKSLSYDEYEKNLAKLILTQVIDQNFDSFTIVNLLPLTQFLVGLILYLGCFVFKEIKLEMSTHLIKCLSFREEGKENARFLLNELNGACVSVVGICDTKFLFTAHNSDLYKSIIDYNNLLCLKYCSCYLNTISLK